MKLKMIPIALFLLNLLSCQDEIQSEAKEDTQKNKSEIIDEAITKASNTIEKFKYFDDYFTLSTRAELVKEFGEIALLDGVSWYAEGEIKRDHSLLVNPKNGHVLKFVWAENSDSLESIEASYYLWNDNSEIEGYQELKTKDGLELGMPLEALKKWNGADFKFSGFGWDYAGGVFAEKGSKLYESTISVTLMNDQNNLDDKFDFTIGDVELSTADEKLINAPVLIEQLTYSVSN